MFSVSIEKIDYNMFITIHLNGIYFIEFLP